MSDEWEGGERQGIRWRRGPAAVVAIALIAGGVYVLRNRDQLAIDTDDGPVVQVSDQVEVVVTSPLRAGDRWYCPSTFPVAAYEGGDYRPPQFPRFRDDIRPEQCFADAERAESEGYELAPVPPDVVLAGGVYLEPTRTPSLEDCASTAVFVGFAVPCPTRLPVPADGPSCELDSCTFGGPEGVVIEHRRFRVPPDWNDGAQPQVFLTAVRLQRERGDGSLVVDGAPELVSCGMGEPAVYAPVRLPELVQCPSGVTWIPRFQGDPHEGHTAAFWRQDGIVYGASVEGHGAEAEELLHALIDGIDYVAPDRAP